MPATDLPNSESEEQSTTQKSAAYPVLPIPDGVIFPEMVVTVTLQSPDALQLLDTVTNQQQSAPDGEVRPATILLVPKTDNKFAKVGVTATVEGRDKLPDGTPVVTLRAHHRAIVGSGVIGRTGGLWVQATVAKDPNLTTASASEANEATRSLAVEYRGIAKALLERVGGGRAIGAIPKADKPGPLADSISYWPELSHEQKIKLLETVDIDERLRLATTWAKAALAEIDVRRDIEGKVNEGLEENQREAILRRQLAAIQSELNEGDGDAIADYRAKLAELTVEGAEQLPVSTAEHIEREIDRLERIGNESMESNWIRTWLDTVFDIPWANSASEHIELGAARTILDEDHTGLDEVKERLIEYLAVRQLKAARQAARKQEARDDTRAPSNESRGRRRGGAILALVGPPGVGKTSLGESVARSLGRSFVRLALGGVRDEAEIRGHRRTYVGARAGRLVNALIEAQSMNPVVLLDEIDKVSGGWNGDPSAALLEVLDPAQNHSFRDHYLEFELDLSDVVFIATANTLDTIPGPLLDRMEIISIDGYTTAEKVTIGRDHLLPRLIERNGLLPEELSVDDDALTTVAADYTREAGVRQLERQLDKIVRKAAVKISDQSGSENAEGFSVDVTVDDLDDMLGKPIPREETADRIDRPGIATGLAVTGAGGDVLFVETAMVEGSGEPILTGQLGDVMKESASIVTSLVAIQLEGEGRSMPTDRRVHVHFPAGAVPKDGPSAGITMTTALVSLLTGRQVRSDVAMTGEITLQGKVLPIGGVKQKVLAAHRAGIRKVLLPMGNGRDLEDIPEDVRDLIDIKLVSTIDEVLAEALEPAA